MPSESIKDWNIEHRLGEINVPALLTSGPAR